VSRFLRKFWGLFHDADGNWNVSDAEPGKAEYKILHTAIKKVTEDIERFNLNTCVSAFMVATNDLSKQKINKRAILEPLVRLIAPYAVHIAEELWHGLGNETSVHHTEWPALEESYLVEDSVTYPIAVNGKTRLTVDFPADADKATLEREVLAMEEVQKYLDGKQVRRVIVVPGRMINLVVG
jgi:leucyl-tRNA synthetase